MKDQSTSIGEVIETKLDKALGERYLSYALSTIVSRSLPDVRDGLKPVHRRILYAMHESKNVPEKPFRKSASAVGFVMMSYHPHGNDPIYDAMVRMAQGFSSRFPLIEGQGNFGSIDGDNAAAMRYTEARLAKTSMSLLNGIHEDAVGFQPTYNGEGKEPIVLPGAFPNLLANGAVGIAVGMATNSPPHNVGEVCEALLYLIKHPNAGFDRLMHVLPGPDFPTGGVIVEEKAAIQKAYETGRGSIRLRSRWEKETLKGGQYQIVITEIPYQVQKARLIEKIADLWAKKKLPLLADIRDESTIDIRIVLTPRSRTVEPEILMESLFKATDLETRFNMNMNFLDKGKIPRVMNIREVLQAYLDHQQEVLCRRSRHRLSRIEHRLEVLSGYMIAYLNIDEVIRIIRHEEEPKKTMMERWDLSEVQVEAILNMKLRALRKLEEIEIRDEIEALEAEKNALNDLLFSEDLQWKKISEQVKAIRREFGGNTQLGKRHTTFEQAPEIEDIPLEAMIEREPVTVVCSEKGWIRALKGHSSDTSDLKYKEGDEERFIMQAETIDKIIIFASNGRFYTLGADKLPGGRGHGEPLSLMIDLPNDEHIVTMFIQKPVDKDRKLLVASSDGRGFCVLIQDVIAHTKQGKQILNVPPKKKARICVPITGDSVAIIGNNRKMVVFKLTEVPQLSRGRGVILQRYREGQLSDLKTFTMTEGLTWKIGDRTRTETDLMPWLGRRGQSGRLPPVGFPRTNKFS